MLTYYHSSLFIRRGGRVVSKYGDVGRVVEDTVALIACGFLQDVKFHETRYETVGSGVGGASEFLNLSDGDYGSLVKGFQHAVSVTSGASEMGGDSCAVLFEKVREIEHGLE